MSPPLAQLRFDESDDAVLVGRVVGEIESANADALRDALVRHLRNDSAGLALDLSSTSYLDSAAIELLFELARRLRTHRQRLCLVVPASAPMRRVLDLCEIDTVAEIYETIDEVFRAMRQDSDAGGAG
jgi:anti-anti-sigma factor